MSSHFGLRTLVVLALLVASACAPKIVPAPIVTTPKYPEFVAPVVPPSLGRSPATVSQDRGWRFLQFGDLKNAEHEFVLALKAAPVFFPAETGLGYVELARKDGKAALPHFDRALERAHSDVSALVGRGQALLALNRDSDALAAFEAALAADPLLADVSRRVDVLKFRSVESDLARARQAARAGQLDEAAGAYRSAIAGSPDSPLLYRELGGVERQQGNVDQALEHFRKAVSLDPTDAKSLVQIGQLFEGLDDAQAAEAYAAAVAIEPNEEVEAKLESVRARLALARLPEEYRAIDQAPQITRADLAALIGVRLAAMVRASRQPDAVPITDVRGSWAATWIMAVARAGMMEPFANHAFQPRTLVRRSDLAVTVSRILSGIAANPAETGTWQAARIKFTDLAPGHLAYPAASAAVASGVMKIGPDNAFQPSRPVTGAEAIETIGRLEALAGSARARGKVDR